MRTMLAVMVGVVGTIVAVAAQQPTGSTPTPEKVIEALKGKTPPAAEPVTPSPPETDASLAAVLARYEKMIAAGQATPTPKATPGTAVGVKTGPTLVSTAPVADTVSPSTAPSLMPSAVSTTADTLDAIRADLRAALGRLDALARKGGQ